MSFVFSSALFKKCHLKNMLAERIKCILNQTSARIPEYSRDARLTESVMKNENLYLEVRRTR